MILNYHLVATYSVMMESFSSWPIILARPKSASFALHSESRSTLAGFKSLTENIGLIRLPVDEPCRVDVLERFEDLVNDVLAVDKL
jgi:hypothetical protein